MRQGEGNLTTSPHAVGISTAWNALRHASGRDMVRELTDLGFDTLELNVHVTPSMIEDVSGMVDRGEVRIGSLHNYCPLPKGMSRKAAAGNVLLLSVQNEADRARAVAQTEQTIRWAARLGASAVVLHMGVVPLEFRQREALRLIGAGYRERAKAMIAEEMEKRTAARGPYLESAVASAGELATFAESEGVRLGLETRYYGGEIPSLDEFETIFNQVTSPVLGYWHDTGHAHTMETLGIARQTEYLERYGDRLIGIHLHDAVGGSDHRAIGRGEIDFAQVLRYKKRETQLVIEVHSQASVAELVRGRDAILRLLQNDGGSP